MHECMVSPSGYRTHTATLHNMEQFSTESHPSVSVNYLYEQIRHRSGGTIVQQILALTHYPPTPRTLALIPLHLINIPPKFSFQPFL